MASRRAQASEPTTLGRRLTRPRWRKTSATSSTDKPSARPAISAPTKLSRPGGPAGPRERSRSASPEKKEKERQRAEVVLEVEEKEKRPPKRVPVPILFSAPKNTPPPLPSSSKLSNPSDALPPSRPPSPPYVPPQPAPAAVPEEDPYEEVDLVPPPRIHSPPASSAYSFTPSLKEQLMATTAYATAASPPPFARPDSWATNTTPGLAGRGAGLLYPSPSAPALPSLAMRSPPMSPYSRAQEPFPSLRSPPRSSPPPTNPNSNSSPNMNFTNFHLRPPALSTASSPSIPADRPLATLLTHNVRAESFVPLRARPVDKVDVLDVTDPWGGHWHHGSPYDVLAPGAGRGRGRGGSGHATPVGRMDISANRSRHNSSAPSPLSKSTTASQLSLPNVVPTFPLSPSSSASTPPGPPPTRSRISLDPPPAPLPPLQHAAGIVQRAEEDEQDQERLMGDLLAHSVKRERRRTGLMGMFSGSGSSTPSEEREGNKGPRVQRRLSKGKRNSMIVRRDSDKSRRGSLSRKGSGRRGKRHSVVGGGREEREWMEGDAEPVREEEEREESGETIKPVLKPELEEAKEVFPGPMAASPRPMSPAPQPQSVPAPTPSQPAPISSPPTQAPTPSKRASYEAQPKLFPVLQPQLPPQPQPARRVSGSFEVVRGRRVSGDNRPPPGREKDKDKVEVSPSKVALPLSRQASPEKEQDEAPVPAPVPAAPPAAHLSPAKPTFSVSTAPLKSSPKSITARKPSIFSRQPNTNRVPSSNTIVSSPARLGSKPPPTIAPAYMLRNESGSIRTKDSSATQSGTGFLRALSRAFSLWPRRSSATPSKPALPPLPLLPPQAVNLSPTTTRSVSPDLPGLGRLMIANPDSATDNSDRESERRFKPLPETGLPAMPMPMPRASEEAARVPGAFPVPVAVSFPTAPVRQRSTSLQSPSTPTLPETQAETRRRSGSFISFLRPGQGHSQEEMMAKATVTRLPRDASFQSFNGSASAEVLSRRSEEQAPEARSRMRRLSATFFPERERERQARAEEGDEEPTVRARRSGSFWTRSHKEKEKEKEEGEGEAQPQEPSRRLSKFWVGSASSSPEKETAARRSEELQHPTQAPRLSGFWAGSPPSAPEKENEAPRSEEQQSRMRRLSGMFSHAPAASTEKENDLPAPARRSEEQQQQPSPSRMRRLSGMFSHASGSSTEKEKEREKERSARSSDERPRLTANDRTLSATSVLLDPGPAIIKEAFQAPAKDKTPKGSEYHSSAIEYRKSFRNATPAPEAPMKSSPPKVSRVPAPAPAATPAVVPVDMTPPSWASPPVPTRQVALPPSPASTADTVRKPELQRGQSTETIRGMGKQWAVVERPAPSRRASHDRTETYHTLTEMGWGPPPGENGSVSSRRSRSLEQHIPVVQLRAMQRAAEEAEAAERMQNHTPLARYRSKPAAAARRSSGSGSGSGRPERRESFGGERRESLSRDRRESLGRDRPEQRSSRAPRPTYVRQRSTSIDSSQTSEYYGYAQPGYGYGPIAPMGAYPISGPAYGARAYPRAIEPPPMMGRPGSQRTQVYPADMRGRQIVSGPLPRGYSAAPPPAPERPHMSSANSAPPQIGPLQHSHGSAFTSFSIAPLDGPLQTYPAAQSGQMITVPKIIPAPNTDWMRLNEPRNPHEPPMQNPLPAPPRPTYYAVSSADYWKSQNGGDDRAVVSMSL